MMASTQPVNPSSFLSERSSSSAQLWAHLLRKDSSSSTLASTSDSNYSIIPPLAPSDRNSTSMRILLHDTQAHFEKFSAKVDKLISHVDNTGKEISTVNTVFQREHEALIGELVDLVNRSQTEIQKATGCPAQAGKLETLTSLMDHRLEAIDKRLDAIHSFNQTHSQALQLQSQAIQALQDQQRTITSALIPLIPLVQTIPLHIHSARDVIKDELSKLAHTGANTATDGSCRLLTDMSRLNNGKRGREMYDSDELAPLSTPSIKKIRRQPPELDILPTSSCWSPKPSSSPQVQSSTSLALPKRSSHSKTKPHPLVPNLALHELFTPDKPVSSRRPLDRSLTNRILQPIARAASSGPSGKAFRAKPVLPSRGSRGTVASAKQPTPGLASRFCTPSVSSTPHSAASYSRTPLSKIFPANLGSVATVKDPLPLPLLPPPPLRTALARSSVTPGPRHIINAHTSRLAPTPLADKILGGNRSSPQRDGRRFIPLVDSDEEDSNMNGQ